MVEFCTASRRWHGTEDARNWRQKQDFFNKVELRPAIEALLSKCDPNHQIYVSRCKEPWFSWEKIHVEGDEDYENQTTDIDYKQLPPQEVPTLYLPEGFMSVTPYGDPWGKRIYDAVSAGIARSIRGDFVPRACVFGFGYHEFVDDGAPGEATLLGRAHFSCGFWGYGSPNNPLEFEKQLFQLPEVIDIQTELERIVGPLQTCFYFAG